MRQIYLILILLTATRATAGAFRNTIAMRKLTYKLERAHRKSLGLLPVSNSSAYQCTHSFDTIECQHRMRCSLPFESLSTLLQICVCRLRRSLFKTEPMHGMFAASQGGTAETSLSRKERQRSFPPTTSTNNHQTSPRHTIQSLHNSMARTVGGKTHSVEALAKYQEYTAGYLGSRERWPFDDGPCWETPMRPSASMASVNRELSISLTTTTSRFSDSVTIIRHQGSTEDFDPF